MFWVFSRHPPPSGLSMAESGLSALGTLFRRLSIRHAYHVLIPGGPVVFKQTMTVMMMMMMMLMMMMLLMLIVMR